MLAYPFCHRHAAASTPPPRRASSRLLASLPFRCLVIGNSKHLGAHGTFKRIAYLRLAHPHIVQACRRIHATAVVRKLKAAHLVAFSGVLRSSTEQAGSARRPPRLHRSNSEPLSEATTATRRLSLPPPLKNRAESSR